MPRVINSVTWYLKNQTVVSELLEERGFVWLVLNRYAVAERKSDWPLEVKDA